MVLENMISLYESRSCSLYPPWWMSFICLRTVDWAEETAKHEISAVVSKNEETDLARLSSTQQQHLDLVLRHHAVPLELVFDLVIAWRGSGMSDTKYMV